MFSRSAFVGEKRLIENIFLIIVIFLENKYIKTLLNSNKMLSKTIVGYSMPIPLYRYKINIYDMLTHFVDNILKRAFGLFVFCTQLNCFKYCYITDTI